MLRQKYILIQLFLSLMLMLVSACSDKAMLKRRVKNTIRASGFTSDTNRIFKSTGSELKIYDLKPKETVAEIGFGTGWLAGVILLRYDSLIYYANDIDEASLAAIGTVTKKFTALRKTPDTNTLIVTRGTSGKTNLPATSFDKIIIRETLHHFEYPNDMLRDTKNLLKPGGRVYVYEPAVESTFFNKSCGAINYSKADLLKFFENAQLTLLAEHDLYNSPGNMPSWWATARTKITPKKVFVLGSN